MVCCYIRQWVDDNVLNHIANDTHAKTLWDKLETLYASKLGNNKLFLLKQAMNLRYKEDMSISDNLSEFQGCFDQLSSMGVKFEDEILGLWLLNTLPDSWENLHVTLTNSAPSGVVTMDFVKTAILNEEVKHQTQQTSSSQAEILVTENRGRSRDRNQDGGHRSKSKSKWKAFECNYCGKKGHLQKYCYKLKNDNEDKQEKKNDENGNRVSTTTANNLVIVYDENLINVACVDSS